MSTSLLPAPLSAPSAAPLHTDVSDRETAYLEEIAELRGMVVDLAAELKRTARRLVSADASRATPRQMRSRPASRLRSMSLRKETPLGTMFVHVTEDPAGDPFDVFINLGKAGGSAMADAEALGRMISLALRSGIRLPEVVKQLRGISSDRSVGLGPRRVRSVPDAIGTVLAEWWAERQGVQQELLPVAGSAPVALGARDEDDAGSYGQCPDCGAALTINAGGEQCSVSCGFVAPT